MLAILSSALVLAAAQQQPPPPDAPDGRETVITFVGGGGLRDWRRDPSRRDVLLVRDRTERWYRVTLSGPCGAFRRSLDTLSYTTDPNGTFDRFSRIRFGSFPNQQCRVRSIVASVSPELTRPR